MLKIGDFSRIARVSIRMLRHYDQLDLFKPNTIDSITGYRSYSIEQLPQINRIVFLKDMGFSLNEIKSLVAQNISTKNMQEMLLQRQNDIKNDIAMAQINLHSVQSRLAQIQEEGKVPDYDIVVKEIPDIAYISIRRIISNAKDMGTHCYDMHNKVYAFLNEHKISYKKDELTIYHNEAYTEVDLDVEIGVEVDSSKLDKTLIKHLSSNTLPNNTYDITYNQLKGRDKLASLIYKGSIKEIDHAILELLKWIGSHNYEMDGPVYERHLSGPVHQNDCIVDCVVIELQIPIK